MHRKGVDSAAARRQDFGRRALLYWQISVKKCGCAAWWRDDTAPNAQSILNVKGDKNRVTSHYHVYNYTITFQVADGTARTMLQNCAMPPNECLGKQGYFETPTVAAVQDVFANIVLGLNQLQLAN